MRWPLDRIVVTQGFGLNPRIYAQFGLKGHNGIDYRTKFEDSPEGKRLLLSPVEGIVTEVKNEGSSGYGLFIRLRDGRYEHVLGHLAAAAVKSGQSVKEGQIIGTTDNTGFSTAPHLHWGVREYDGRGIVNYNNGYRGYFDHSHLIGSGKGDEAMIRIENGSTVEVGFNNTDLRTVPTEDAGKFVVTGYLGKGDRAEVIGQTDDLRWVNVNAAGIKRGWLKFDRLAAVAYRSDLIARMERAEAEVSNLYIVIDGLKGQVSAFDQQRIEQREAYETRLKEKDAEIERLRKEKPATDGFVFKLFGFEILIREKKQ